MHKHHAYCLIGGESIREDLLKHLETEHGISETANSDFFNRVYENFNIEDAREVKTNAGIRPTNESGKKIYILKMDNANIEAQNALLKLLEEPAEYAHFYIIIPSAHLLLPTVKSRLLFLDLGYEGKDGPRHKSKSEYQKMANEFVDSKPAKRLEIIKNLIDDIGKEKKRKQDAIEFLNAIEDVIYTRDGVSNGFEKLRTLSLPRKYINDRGPSIKMLLEYVALSI